MSIQHIILHSIKICSFIHKHYLYISTWGEFKGSKNNARQILVVEYIMALQCGITHHSLTNMKNECVRHKEISLDNTIFNYLSTVFIEVICKIEIMTLYGMASKTL